jgi:hypothetical protein
MQDNTGRTLRTIGIAAVALAAAMNILGGIGTVCAAFLTKQFPPMWALLDYQLLYQGMMIVTIIIGILGVLATRQLIRGGSGAYQRALLVLVVGTIVAGIHLYASMVLRGKGVPTNMKLYANALGLLIFLLYRLPGIWERIRFDQPADSASQASNTGLAAILAGSLVFTTIFWAGPSHTYGGANWVDLLKLPLYVSGATLTLGGAALVLKGRIARLGSLFGSEASPSSALTAKE